jgi:serine/threonine-protein phosphatase 2A regulatory subunit A
MLNEEVHVKVNAIHRLKTVILSIGPEESVGQLIPYIDTLIKDEDDEVLFAIAEELGKCFSLINDKTVFLPSLEALAKKDETVVRE